MKCVGIVREAYNKWERRAPLCPEHVKQLVKNGIQVVIQPCTRRVYSNEQYRSMGATISEDLSSSQVILGVKQVPADHLIRDKTYMFFSHTIKAQAENMALLDAVLAKNIRLVDYECITHGGKRNGKRLIAFGSYAGRAGMIDTFRGVGERLLSKGHNTPFLNIGSAYMYGTLDQAKEAIERAGREISKHGLPKDVAPMTFVFTGNGNVSKGAQELFELLPHTMVDANDLNALPTDPNRLYGCIVNESHMVEKKDGGKVTRQEYYKNPNLFVPTFHEKVIPHTSVLMNCMYWDDRFPRLLTNSQLQGLYQKKQHKLIGIGDISCDVMGSVECLTHTTDIEKPFYMYDVEADCTRDNLDGDGVMMMGVDILPSELPRESSQYFGNQLLPFLKPLLQTNPLVPLAQQEGLPEELKGACIANNGTLSSAFSYIQEIRADKSRSLSMEAAKELEANAGSTCIRIQGNLFDTSLINKVLNEIEKRGGQFYIVDCQVSPNTVKHSVSRAIVQVSMESHEALNATIDGIKSLCKSTKGADASVKELVDFCAGNYSKTKSSRPVERKDGAGMSEFDDLITVQNMDKKKVVCLGAGLVVLPLLEYLSRNAGTEVEVVSAVPGEADQLVRKLGRRNVRGKQLDAVQDHAKIEALCATASCVVSLLPATMHVPVAKSCIKHGTPLVTASYISPEMKQLDEEAKQCGIPILCEMGLDPGMDHMSAMKVIDEVKAENGKIIHFSSVCGGLPAPEAANNPMGYKFSWSPRGVLTAAQNAARYRADGKIIEVSGEEMLSKAKRVHFLPAFSLEQLPNRDSVPYGDIYGISDASSVFRGTLRYAGWSNIMYQCKKLGLLDSAPKQLPGSWNAIMDQLNSTVKLEKDTKACLEWLGVYNTEKMTPQATTMDTFCDLLQNKLSYAPGERDMALMHHEFEFQNANGQHEKKTSTYVGYGDDQGNTIMAKTVGVTAAVGVQLILDNTLQRHGVLAPITPDIYLPGLAMLQAEGITFSEK